MKQILEKLPKNLLVSGPISDVPMSVEFTGEAVEECQHEYGDMVYLSNPPQYKCQKCGEFTTKKLITPFDKQKPEKVVKKIGKMSWRYSGEDIDIIAGKVDELTEVINHLIENHG